jgi:tetratricopeptide (TPR) repeat protein
MTSRIRRAALAAVLSLSAPARAAVDLPAAPPAETELLGKAKALAAEGKYAEAEAALAAATSPAARWSRAVIVSRQGRYAEAVAALRAIAAEVGGKLELRDPDGWLLLAAAWKAPPEALAAHARGFHLSTQERCEEAKASLEEALRLAPQLADARYHLGYCLGQLGDDAGAERELRAAIKGYARSERFLQASAQYSLGNLLVRRGAEGAREATGFLRQAMASEGQGRSPAVLVALGNACAALKELPCGRASFAEAIERLERGEQREFPMEAQRQLRNVLWQEGCARRPARVAEGTPPRCAAPGAIERVSLSSRALAEGKVTEAEAAARAASALEPGFGAAWFLLGRSLIEQERFADAEAALRNARAHSGWLDATQAAGATSLLAHALVKRGSTTGEAVRLANEAATASMTPDDPTSRVWFQTLIGRAFAVAGNRPCALARLRDAVSVLGAPEELASRAQTILKEVEGSPGPNKECFEYQLYVPATLAATWRAYRSAHPLEQVSGRASDNYEIHPTERHRARIHFTGARRPISGPLARMLAEFAGGPPGFGWTWKELGQLYKQEAEILEAGQKRWIAIPDGLADALAKELPGGGDADAYVSFFGALNDTPLFFLGEFDASACGPG